MENVLTAITGLGTSVAQNGLSAVVNLLPVMATLTAGLIVANIGRRIVVRFAR